MGTRNLFLCDGQLVLSTFYSKTRSLNDGASKPVARFPDAVTSGLLLLYLAVVRPLEFGVVKSMAAVAGGSLEVDEQRVYLFARRGRSVAGTHLCAWFRETMKENGLENVTVSLYRQYQAGVVKNFFREVEGAETRVMHMQAGHSEDTAHRVYGVSDADFRHLTGTELEAYRSYSQRWHTALGLVHGPPRPYGASLAEKSASGYKEIVATAVENKTDELLHAVLDRLARMEKQMTEVISAKRSDTNTPVKEWEETAAEPSLKRVKISGPGIAEHRQEEDESLALQGALEKFLGASKPESVAFKSPLQRKAVEMVKQRNTDVVVILPTGGGKSLCFMLPCFLETNAVTVLVVPLVALQVDMLDRCTRAGIDAASWSGRERVGVRVVIASVEHVLTDQYRIFVAELVRCGKLSRVVVDEAHLIPMWASFRSSLKSLATFVRPPGITVPVVMLTATAPPALVPLMTEMCGVSRYQVVRAASYRPNISYRVERQPGAAGSITFYMRAAGKVLETIEKYRSDSAHSRVIVYMQTRAAVDTLCSILCCEASTAAYRYHAGMANEDRVRAQKAWADNVDGAERFKVMVATSAFGTGIDYPSIRAVVHVEGARSLLEFIQESGRAGRDGHAAESIVLLAEGGRDSMPASSPDEWKEIMHGDGSPNSHDAALWQISGDFGSYISAETQCRRQLLDSFCDGNREVLCCLRRAEGGIKAVLCDLCEQKRSPGGSSSSDQGKPGAPSFAGKEAADNEKPWAELYHGEQHGISADWTRPDVAKSAEAAQKQRELAEREVSQLRELAARFADVCAVCTVAYSVEVRHSPGRPNETNSDGCAQYLPCQAGRCDRCGLKGHSWMSCKLNAKPERNQGCARCGISKHRGLLVHRDGEFGKRGCSVKNVLSIALLCWEEEKHRQSLKNEFSDLRPVQEIQQYAAWLRCALHGRAGAPLQTGLARIARWLLLSFCRKS
jgi:superfamily II DNA or RNA helicase